MTASDLNAMNSSPAAFRDALIIPGGRGPIRIGQAMAPYQAKDFTAMDRAFLALAAGQKPDVGRFWWERTKGASKDSDLAVMLLWLLAFSTRPLTCQVGAADQDQADELRKAAKGILRLNPWLAGIVTVQNWNLMNTRTDARAEIVAADVTGSHGARPDLLVLNELSHVGKQEFAENLMDNASKVPHGLVCVATNAGFVPSWQWDWRENARTSKRWYWSALTTPAPWLDPAEIAEAKRRNSPSRFARLWEGKWVSGGGDALDAQDLEAACVLQGPYVGKAAYYAGLDLAVSRDHAAFVSIGLCSDRRLRLSAIESWAPRLGIFGRKIDLAKVEAAVLAAHRLRRFVKLLYDPFQAELLAQNLIRQGVRMEACPFTGGNLMAMASAILERFGSRSIWIWRDEQLLADLGRLRLIDKGMGGYRLDSPRTKSGHGDRATGLCLAVLASERYPRSAWSGEGSGISMGGAIKLPRGMFGAPEDDQERRKLYGPED